MHNKSLAFMEFHVSRSARDRYQFDQSIFTTTGNVIFADVHAARIFAQKINATRDLQNHPEQAISAAQINAMGLIDEILHQMIAEYRQRNNLRLMVLALDHLNKDLGENALNTTLRRFVNDFPPVAIYRGEQSVDEYLAGSSQRANGEIASNRELALEEMLVLWLENENPAFSPFLELFDDAALERDTAYYHVFPSLYEFFAGQPTFGPANQNLMDMLLSPARAHPDSLEAQLNFLRSNWQNLLSFILLRLLGGMDVIREETKPVYDGTGGGGPSLVYEFGGDQYLYEPENFSVDLDWMPNLVLIAKNTYVWLDQLARKYQRQITRLDEVPEDELKTLRRSGITGLWLIGLWERSPASQQIKQLRGNPNAVASAYSLFSYDIAADLGGDEAYARLRERAWRNGVRLASDMVPNHMGIDSRWVIEHPDWFIQLPYSPFPAYSFNGPNLSLDERVGLFIEDHYFDNTDAAVVFKRVDNWTGDVRYVYHGNDGTSIPWNDTAQLNYLIPEVREAVIQTILHVARKFPIIRFDAAMTLAKKHYQRLWFPEPGTGGAIASRAEQGLTKPQFDEVFPEEFWRMVVDRVAQEAPDTLLLAEAFWLMEGYFVRTLGMHRVYNSAFMNMLRDEKNQEFRLTIKNTLEFDVEILKRYVNFMNNPDERTAVDQFGKGDKYFGVAVMLSTLPGLPMIGHGQIEGFGEKYGMEFRYPLWHEQPDQDLVARHEAEIFPLLRQRYLFAEVRDFLLYDFYTSDGRVNEDVFAYSNRAGDEAALVVYNNRYAEADGWIHTSAAYAEKTGNEDEKIFVHRTLGQGLGLRSEPDFYTIFRDHRSGLEHLSHSADLVTNGMHFHLGAYQYQVYFGFRQVQDDPKGSYGRLFSDLHGQGVPSIEIALREMELQPVLGPFRELVNPGMFQWLIQNRINAESFEPANFQMAINEVEHKALTLLAALKQYIVSNELIEPVSDSSQLSEGQSDLLVQAPADILEPAASSFVIGVDSSASADATANTGSPVTNQDGSVEQIALRMRDLFETILSVSRYERHDSAASNEFRSSMQYLMAGPKPSAAIQKGDPEVWGMLFSLGIIDSLGRLATPGKSGVYSRRWMDDLLLSKQIVEALMGIGIDAITARRATELIQLVVGSESAQEAGLEPQAQARHLLHGWLGDILGKRVILAHEYQGEQWFSKEAFEELVWWVYAWRLVSCAVEARDENEFMHQSAAAYAVIRELLAAEERSGFHTDRLVS